MMDEINLKYILSKFVIVFVLTVIQGAETAIVVSKYQIYENKSSADAAVIDTVEVVSLVRCFSSIKIWIQL